MSLAELLSRMDQEGARQTGPKPLPEAVCATLREAAARYMRVCPFAPGQLITPCAASDLTGKGEPHIVLEVIDRPAPNFECAKEPSDVGSNNYGGRADVRIARQVGGDVLAHWGESWQFEPYCGPGSEAAAV